MRICAFTHCSNSTYTLNQWKTKTCEKHGVRNSVGECDCEAPFVLYTFPSQKKRPEERIAWINAVKRYDPVKRKPWQPTRDSRICSNHFIGNSKSEICSVPCINLGYKDDKRLRLPPKKRETTEKTKPLPIVPIAELVAMDHTYSFECDCCPGCNCRGCEDKEKKVKVLNYELSLLKYASAENSNVPYNESICDMFLTNDAKVKAYTGLKSKDAFESLHNLLQPKAEKLKYWRGEKSTITWSRPFKSSPNKMGPQRKLTTKQELLMVLMKLRLGVNSVLLGDIMGVSESLVSIIFNTWIKFLSTELKPCIYWPSTEEIRLDIPSTLKGYKNLRCTIDCTEIFISRPKDRELQALTWSDYKKHNTVKFLIGIAPNGSITYLSKAWGGRATDRHITLHDGFIDLVEPFDLILADRGFTIKEDILQKMATLEIPPPSSGLEQMTPQDVQKTKKVANARIHVERAINRIKWFAILKDTLPVNLVPLIDDILIVCAALCNFLPPLVK